MSSFESLKKQEMYFNHLEKKKVSRNLTQDGPEVVHSKGFEVAVINYVQKHKEKIYILVSLRESQCRN